MRLIADRQVPAVHRRRIGDILITCISDGVLTGSMAALQNIDPDEAASMLRAAFRPVPRQASVNTFLIHSKGRTALIDTGCGPDMQPSVGKLFENLAAADIPPKEIDAVLLTHMHPDHSNGLADRSEQALFPNAELILHEAEPAYWNDDGAKTRAAETGQGVFYFSEARRQLAPYQDRLRPFNRGEVFPGITAVPLPGHTPGHTGYLIDGGEETMFVWGDIVHVPEIQISRPEVTMQFDVDPDQAVTTRRRVLDMVATDGQLTAGMHLHFPGYAHVVREGASYRLVSEPWRQSL